MLTLLSSLLPLRCMQGLEPDTICYNTLISCLERSNQPDRALEVFEQMQVRWQAFADLAACLAWGQKLPCCFFMLWKASVFPASISFSPPWPPTLHCRLRAWQEAAPRMPRSATSLQSRASGTNCARQCRSKVGGCKGA